jgi:hypothetical protein
VRTWRARCFERYAPREVALAVGRSPFAALRRRARIHDLEIGVVRLEEATVARQQAVGPGAGVRSDEEVCDDALALAAATAILGPGRAGVERLTLVKRRE